MVYFQAYPDTIRYELTLGKRNHSIHLEKNRYMHFFVVVVFVNFVVFVFSTKTHLYLKKNIYIYPISF